MPDTVYIYAPSTPVVAKLKISLAITVISSNVPSSFLIVTGISMLVGSTVYTLSIVSPHASHL